MGKPVKLSAEIISYIHKRRRDEEEIVPTPGKRIRKRRRTATKLESYDAALRRLFGLSSMRGTKQPLRTYYVLPNEGEPLIFQQKSEARGAAIVRAVRKGLRRAEAVLTVRELP